MGASGTLFDVLEAGFRLGGAECARVLEAWRFGVLLDCLQ